MQWNCPVFRINTLKPPRQQGSIALVLALLFAGTIQGQTWSSRDVGSVGKVGSYGYNTTTQVHTLKGSGTDIWGTADAFRFAYQTFNGDGEIQARVVTQSNTNTWAKAGVMIRETLNANSRHVMTVITPGQGVSFQRRTNTGGSSTSTTFAGPRVPYWVRVVRTGNVFQSYRSADGTSWISLGSVTIAMPANVQIGLAVTSHNNSTRSTATFDNVLIGRRPYVTAPAPANGATNVYRDTAINGDVFLPNPGAGVDDTTLNTSTVQLYRTSDLAGVPAGV